MATAPRRWSSTTRRSATSPCISTHGIRAPAPSRSGAWATSSTCHARPGCRGRLMCVTSSPPWTPRSMAGSRTCCSSPRGSTRWPAIRSAASRSRPTTSRHGPPPCVNASPRRRSWACSRVATGWTCSPPASARTCARLPDRKAAPILPPMALRLAIEECTLTTRHPFVIARGSTTGYRRVWVRVIDEEGLEGWGEADPSSYYGENYDSVRATIAEAGAFPVLKIKLGTDRDEAILRTVRDLTDKPIRVDANAGWTLERALRMLPILKEHGVELLEQPLAPEDLEGTARVTAAAGDLPVVVDESCLVASDIPRLAGKADGINIKLAKCGSLREALRMVAVARAHGMVVMVGCMIESSLGITAAAHFTPLVDYADLDGAALTVDDPFAGATIDGGQIRLPAQPGLGLPPPAGGGGPIPDAPDPGPALSPPLLELGRWISRYYGAPLGLALRAILPGPLWSVQRPAGPAAVSERVVVLAQPLGSLLERERAFRRAPRRRAAYEALEALGGSAPVRHLVDQLKLSPAVLDGLVQQGLARVERVAAVRDPFAGLSSPPPPVLTEDQRRAGGRVARAAPRGAPRGGGPPLRGVRTGPAARGDRRGRGARAELQAGNGAALPRTRRRAGAGAARKGGGATAVR